MKKYILDFLKRGLMFAIGGPIILAIIYLLENSDKITVLSPKEAASSIISVTIIAFIAAGITIVYQIEKLPIFSAILIHGTVLYFDYLIMYFINNWMPRNLKALGIFTLIFVVSFTAVWLIIYISVKVKTDRINKKLNK